MSTLNWNVAGTLFHPVRPEEAWDAEDLNQRAIALFGGGDAAGALRDFGRAAALRPDVAEAWNNRGLVLQTLGRLEEAVADFGRALAARPDYPEALSNRGRARRALGDPDGAEADFDRAFACASGGFAASVLHNRGALRQARGNVAGALADFDRALQLDPGHTATHVLRGQARKEAGDLDGALADLDRALDGRGPRPGAATYHARGGVRVLRRDFAGAVADYERALALEPDNVLLYLSRGNARYHLRDTRAVEDFRTAFRLGADAAAREVMRLLAEGVRQGAGDVLENCRKHLRRNGGDVLAFARRGLTLLLLGRTAEAEPDLARARALAPNLASFLDRLIEQATRPVGEQPASSMAEEVAVSSGAGLRHPNDLGAARCRSGSRAS